MAAPAPARIEDADGHHGGCPGTFAAPKCCWHGSTTEGDAAMLFGRQISDQELLARLYQATLKLDETSAHARRRLREAQICLRQLQHMDSPPLSDRTQKRAS